MNFSRTARALLHAQVRTMLVSLDAVVHMASALGDSLAEDELKSLMELKGMALSWRKELDQATPRDEYKSTVYRSIYPEMRHFKNDSE